MPFGPLVHCKHTAYGEVQSALQNGQVEVEFVKLSYEDAGQKAIKVGENDEHTQHQLKRKFLVYETSSRRIFTNFGKNLGKIIC